MNNSDEVHAASLAKADDPQTPRYSTDEVMRRMDAIIQAAHGQHAMPHTDWWSPTT